MDRLPLRLKLCLLLCPVATLFAQQAPTPENEPKPGSLEGSVLSNMGQPLRRAQVLLRPMQAGIAALVQTTDETGKFSFPKLTPGRYSITIQRDGYLPLFAGHVGPYKMPPIFYVRPGDEIRNFTFTMMPWGVLGGRIKFDDAEPAVNVVVQLYREQFDRGRHGFVVAATTRTNDRGEYRFHGLDPGSYYVAALYQAPPLPPNAEEQRRTDVLGKPAPDFSYVVTFFPEAQKMADAVAVRVAAGGEVGGIDIFLTLVHTVRIHGRVTSAVSGQPVPGPSITLRWNDADNTGSVSAPVDVSFDRNQRFQIKGVTPGPYLIVTTGADDGKSLSGRTPIQVGEDDIDSLEIVIGPEQKWKGSIHVEGDEGTKLPGLAVQFQPRRSTAFVSRAPVDSSLEFALPFLPQETYDFEVLNAPEDMYLKSVMIGSNDRLATGLEAEPGDTPPAMEVVLSNRGGKLLGKAVATDSSIVATGASVMLVPDPPNGRSQTYKSTYADEFGNFLVKGIAPGKYVVVAWFDQPPCEIYNPDDMAACRARGASLTVSEGALESVQVTAY
ncbi:MAG TPA: carboxypeptidase regulatory-like domain-containing protein [Bryobacteraceae bacterium]|nr:carboxypeptidase regulatory-like domain-containing protein [Bryobacteraceae bacterium]